MLQVGNSVTLEAEKDKSQSINKTVRVINHKHRNNMKTLRISAEPNVQFKARSTIYTDDRYTSIDDLFEKITILPDRTTTIAFTYMTTNKIESIKAVRANMNYGLKEAKELLEFCERNQFDLHMTHW